MLADAALSSTQGEWWSAPKNGSKTNDSIGPFRMDAETMMTKRKIFSTKQIIMKLREAFIFEFSVIAFEKIVKKIVNDRMQP